MIRIKYIPIFDVEVLHDFYKSGKSADFEVIPTNACKDLLQRHKLLLRPTEFGFEVYSEVNTNLGADIMMNPLPDNAKFTFLLKLKNPSLSNFTDLPLSLAANQTYYFSNLQANLSATNQPLLVKDAGTKAVGMLDVLKKVGTFYSYHHTSVAAKQTGEIAYTESDEFVSKELDNNLHNDFNFSFETRLLSEGKAEFWVAGSKKDEFYLAGALGSQDFFGIVEIFHRSTLTSEYLFLSPTNQILSKSYKIKLNARATVWRYLIFNRFGNTFPSPSVAKTTSPAIAFTKDAGSTTDKLIFYSNTPQILKEEAVSGIKFFRVAADEASVLIPHLPVPTKGLVKQEGSSIYSDILITV